MRPKAAIPGTKNVTKVIPPRVSIRPPEFRLLKMNRNIRGKAKVNTAAAGLRQNAFCSNLTWRAAMARSLMRDRSWARSRPERGRLLGELEVDVLQPGPGDGEVGEGEAPAQGPAGEGVERPGSGRAP